MAVMVAVMVERVVAQAGRHRLRLDALCVC